MHLSNTLSVCFEDTEKTGSQGTEKSNANYNNGHHIQTVKNKCDDTLLWCIIL